MTASAGSISAGDTVTLGNEASGEESGVIAWGGGERQQAFGHSSVAIGVVVPGVANQVVSFTVDRPPALDARVAWTASDDTVALLYPPVYEIPIKFWILCAQYPCDAGIPAWKTANVSGFLVWANERLRAEHVGVRLVRAGGDDWISDETGAQGTGIDILQRFTSEDCDKLSSAIRDMKTPGALNVYMVQMVERRTRNGDSCGTDDSAVVGRNALWGTILHELGHDLSLGHTDKQTWYADVGGKKNLMCKKSATRRFVTEGQVFRMHFATVSGLNGSLFPSLPPNLPPHRIARDCENNTPLDQPCPPEETLLWTDK